MGDASRPEIRRPRETAGAITMIVPGGRHSTGGMCRMADYCASEWEATGRLPAVRVLDSMGPYVKWREPFHFAVCIVRILGAAARGRVALLNLHVAAYGSMLRKGLLLLLGRALRIPVVLHMHGGDFGYFYTGLPRVLRRAVSANLRMADHVVVLGDVWYRFYTTIVGLDGARITVIRNAVPAPPADGAHDGDELVFLGLMSNTKGLGDLLQALADPALAALPWRLTVAGHGDPAPFEAQARALGLAPRVAFRGWLGRREIGTLLAHARVLLLPSHFEAMPMVLLEAMSHGVPIIATRTGGIPEVVEDGVTGILVEPRDGAALAKAIFGLLSDQELCLRLGRQGRQRFLAHFEIGGANDRLQSVFLKVLQARGRMVPACPVADPAAPPGRQPRPDAAVRH